MFTYKAFACLLLVNTLAHAKPQRASFQDVDRGNDFVSRFSENNQNFDIRHNIPGEPEVDYPIYNNAPRTGFNCDNRHEGYYADTQARCQVFRICASTDLTGEGFAFLCPNGTVFSQRSFICDWYRNVDCSESEGYYFLNEKLGKVIRNKEEMLQAVRQMVDHPIKSATKALSQPTVPAFSSAGGSFQDSLAANRRAGSSTNFAQDTLAGGGSNTAKTQRGSTSRQGTQNRSGNPTINDGSRINAKTTKIPITKEEIETADLSKIVPPGKVYVSNLGQLSTDVGSTFDPKSSLIIGEGSQEPSVINARSTKKSTEEHKSKPTRAASIYSNPKSKEKLSETFSGNANDNLTSGTSQSSSHSNRPTLSNKIELPVKIEPPSPYLLPAKKKDPNTMSLAEKINAGLGDDFFSTGGDGQQLFARTSFSGEPNFSFQPTGSLFNFASNINSAFDLATSASTESVAYVRPASKQQTSSSFGSQRNSQGFSRQSGQYSPKSNSNIRNGRQFEFQGSAFTRPGQTTQSIFAPKFSNNPQDRRYLPPVGQGFTKASAASAGVGFKLYKEETTTETITKSTESNPGTIPSLLIDVNDINAVEDIEPPNSGDDDVHVKKRAEHLLLQGVHLTLYENDKEYLGNKIDEFQSSIPSTISVHPTTQSLPTKPTRTITSTIVPTTAKPTPFTIFILPSVEHSTKNDNQIVSSSLQATDKPSVKTYVYTAEYEPDLRYIAATPNPPTTVKLPSIPKQLPPVKPSTISRGSTTSRPSTTSKLPILRQSARKQNDPRRVPSTRSTTPRTTTPRTTTPRTTTTTTQRTTTVQTTRTTRSTTVRQTPTIPEFRTTRQPSTTIRTTPVVKQQSTTPESPRTTRRGAPTRGSLRHTGRPINYSKKPFVTRNYPKTSTTTQPTKYRKRPTRRHSNKIINDNSTSTDDLEDSLVDLTPVAAQDPVRSAFNRLRNDTNSKYVQIRRERLNSDDRKTSFNLRQKSRTSPSILDITPPTRLPSKKFEDDTNIESILQNPSFIPKASRAQNVGADTGAPSGIVDYKSIFNPQQTGAYNPIPDLKKSSSQYVELPGTKIQIAKSQEQAHFSITNDPSLLRNQNASSQQNSFVLLDQFLNKELSNQQVRQTTSSYFFPFPTVNPVKKEIQYNNKLQAFPAIRPSIESRFGDEGPTTRKPFPSKSNNQFINTANNQNQFSSASTGNGYEGLDFEPFPPLSNIQIAQKRLDVVEDENKEKGLYTGVSSYHVPLKSVGRLPGDMVALQSRRKRRS